VTPPSLPLRTDRLLLRTHQPDDVESLLAYYSDPEVCRYIPWEPWSSELAAEQMAKRLQRTGIDGSTTALGLVVERAGQVIGDVGVWCADDTRLRGEVGWAFHPSVAGQGYATEAVRALVDIAFTGYGMRRVFAHVDSRNTASIRLCERIGMTKEAHLREDDWFKGEWTDLLVYGLLAAEWSA
jgi:aminoglycoside 6'-N-acetyltransferase